MNEEPLDPRMFYGDRIPAQFNCELESCRARAEAGDDGDADATYRSLLAVNASLIAIVRGEPDLVFNLNVDAGVMKPDETASHPPLLTLVHDRDSFEALARASGDSILGFLGGLAGMADEMRLTAQRVENLSRLSGSFRFELTGEGGFVLVAHFGAEPMSDAPDASLRMDAEVYRRLSEGELQAQEAFFSGAIEIEGDMQLAVTLALAALAPDA
jgi:putative sterol carrier protein